MLYVSTTDTDALLFVTLLLIDRAGKEHELTRGWLRASQRKPRDDSEPWAPVQAHEAREPLEPGKIYELKIPIVPTARLFQAGERIAVRIKGADDEPALNSLQTLARNYIRRRGPRASRFTTMKPTRRTSIYRSRAAISSALSFQAEISARSDCPSKLARAGDRWITDKPSPSLFPFYDHAPCNHVAS